MAIIDTKILHIIDTLGLGGAQRIVKDIVEHAYFFETSIVYALRAKDNEISINHQNVFICASQSKYSLMPLEELRELITKEQITVLHCHLFRSQVMGYWLKKRYFPHIKLIFHEHGQIVASDDYNPIMDKLYVQFMRHSVKQVNCYIAVSQAIVQALVARAAIPEKQISTLLNFVDLSKFSLEKKESSKKLSISQAKQKFVVGYAGRIVKRKGWREFLQMAEKLQQIAPEQFFFLMAGEGTERALLEKQLVEKTDYITYLGYCSNMLGFYKSIDCLVMPSYFEGLPMVQLEVMALGVPLITADGLGMTEVAIAQKEALYFPVKNVAMMVEKVQFIAQNPHFAQEMSNDAVKKASQFGLENYVRKLRQIYASL
ncbi:MAG: glycosyltransferase family 4 protein [Chitinophagales bacterium]|nr:glycosyltransferase family 4 protein [Bacteroidota bacterium]